MTNMLKRKIPSSGEEIGAVGLGTWQVFDVGGGKAERQPLAGVLEALFSAGGSLVDSSPMYGRAEEVAGDLLAAGRKRAFVATKVWTTGREKGIAEMERSLRFFHGQVDLMQVHNLVDWRTHMETLRGWKDQGRIRYTGITHYTAGAHAELASVMREARPDFVQVNYALGEREAETTILPLARDLGIAVLVNRPLGSGKLLRRLAEKPLPAAAKELGVDNWAALALKFILAADAVTCIIPATSKPANMAANATAATGALPDKRQREQIIAAAEG